MYNLFHRLYAMYPCNFMSYLKQQYVQREQLAIFTHTIRPMLDSVRVHPLLVTASKDAEISATRYTYMYIYIYYIYNVSHICYGILFIQSIVIHLLRNRWKKMEHHDIVIECGRFTLDKYREEILGLANSRCTPPLGQLYYHIYAHILSNEK